MWDGVAILALIGALGGITGGLFGVGGSVVMIPALTEFLGPHQHLYQAACMIVNFFVAAPAVVQHARAQAIDRSMVMRLLPLTVVSIIAGVALSELPFFTGPGENYLRGLFGAYLAVVSGMELFRARPKQASTAEATVRKPLVYTSFDEGSGSTVLDLQTPSDPVRSPVPFPDASGQAEAIQVRAGSSWFTASCIAVPTGLIAGLLGVGGGLVAVPLQLRWFHVPLRTAIANSACVIVATSCVGAVAKNIAFASEHAGSLEPLGLAAVLIPSAILGSIGGSRWLHRCTTWKVRLAFFLLMLVVAARLIMGVARP